MQIKNIKIFDSTNAADGSWTDVSNLVSMSVHVVNLEGTVWIEVSNDPLVNINNPTSQVNAPSAPTLSQAPAVFGGLTGQGTYFVKRTYTTPFGETTASTESSLAISDGSVLMIPAPALDALGIATGWNAYVSKTTGSEVLQTTPAYVPAWQIDSTPGYHYSSSGTLPLGRNLVLQNGWINTGIAPPVSNTGGGPNLGINPLTQTSNATGNLVGITSSDYTAVAIFADTNNGGQAFWAPSSMVWKWVRIRKSNTTQTKETIAYLCGQNG